MKLIALNADKRTFHPVRFNPSGLSLIVGAGSEVGREGSSNGVGKTLALRLVHHCLGGTSDVGIKKVLDDWRFTLQFSLAGREHEIQRSGDGSFLTLDDEEMTVTKLRNWLNASGAFAVVENNRDISFRSLIKRFMRVRLDECEDPLGFGYESPYDRLLRSLYLLGMDTSLAVRKHEAKRRIDSLEKAVGVWQENADLQELFRAGNDARARARLLQETLPALATRLERMTVADDYYNIAETADALTREVRQLEQEEEVLKFQVTRLEGLLAENPDISRAELLQLYEGLEQIFRPEALRHFEAVESFHRSLLGNRRRRLTAELAKLRGAIQDLDARRRIVSDRRDTLVASLKGKTTLEEYRRVADDFAQRQRELGSLEKFLEAEAEAHRQVRDLRASMLEDARHADEYLASGPLAEFDSVYRAITRRLYPELASAISISTNLRDNQLRYDLSVFLEGSSSDGINMARIIAFDWLILTMGANHTVNVLWHDNRMFSHMDPSPRAEWFKGIGRDSITRGKQYIASLNMENFESMMPHLNEDQRNLINGAVILELSGEDPTEKLLGIQVDL